MVVKMRPSDAAHATIAKELALRLAALSFPPEAFHTPGVAHVLADKLSRIHMPGAPGLADQSLHHALAGAELTEVPVRNNDWYLVKEARQGHSS